MKYLLAGLTALTIFTVLGQAPAEARDESLLEDQLNSPDWLTIRGSHRTRFEVLNGPLSDVKGFTRSSRDVGVFPSQILVEDSTVGIISLRTSLFAEANLGSFQFGAELIDSRNYIPVFDRGSGPTTLPGNPAPGVQPRSNAVEPIQAYAAFTFNQGKSRIKAGRFTSDVGSGRIVGRSDFRTATESFHGLEFTSETASGNELTVFYSLPSISDETENQTKYDRPFLGRQFGGIHYQNQSLIPNINAEAFLYNRLILPSFLNQDAFSNRKGFFELTPGLRFSRAPEVNEIDFDIEAAGQFTSNFPNPSQTGAGFFAHVEGGKTFNILDGVRAAVLFDIASGFGQRIESEELFFDPSPNREPYSLTNFTLSNNTNGRPFDAPFGILDEDFGPEGLYGAFSRSNIISPAFRVEARVFENVDLQITYRAASLMRDNLIIDNPSFFSDQGGPGIVITSAVLNRSPGWAHQIDIAGAIELFDGVSLEFGGAYLDIGGQQSFSAFDAATVRPIGTPPVSEQFIASLFPRVDLPRNQTFYGYSSITLNF